MKTYWVTGKQALPGVPEEEIPEVPLPETTSFHPSAPVRSPMNSPRSTPSPPSISSNARVQPYSSIISPNSRTSPILHIAKSESAISQSSKLSRSLSPKPSEWPRAERQLQKYESIAFDNSVPPGGQRRKTVPALKVESEILKQPNRHQSAQKIRRASATNMASPAISIDAIDHKILSSDNNLVASAEVPHMQWWQQNSAGWPPGFIPYNNYQPHLHTQTSGPPPFAMPVQPSGRALGVSPQMGITEVFRPCSFDTHGVRMGITANEAPTLTSNGGIEMKLPSCERDSTPGAESVSSKQEVHVSKVTLTLLKSFAAQAEENAHRARQLADHTAQLLLHVQSAHTNGQLAIQDTSVDPEPSEVKEQLPGSCPLRMSHQQEHKAFNNEHTTEDIGRTNASKEDEQGVSACLIL